MKMKTGVGMSMPTASRPFQALGMLLLMILLLYASAAKMNGREIRWDALENTVASYYLWTQGRISLDGESPSYFREPLPIVVGALHMAVLTDIPKFDNVARWGGQQAEDGRISQSNLRYPAELLDNAEYRKQISQVNLLYLGTCFLALWWLAWLMTRTHWVGALAIFASWLFFYYSYYYLYRPLSEYLASLFIILAAGILVLLVRNPRPAVAVLAGTLFGALALTKAATLYVALVAIPMAALMLALFRLAAPERALALGAAMLLALAVTIAPWMLRNYHHFDDFAIAQRGGAVLLTRAMKNQMTADEFRGAFYVYAPAEIKRIPAFRSYLHGEEAADRYARLFRNRPGDIEAIEAGDVDAATSFFCKSRAWCIKLGEGGELDGRDVDRRAQKIALGMIKAEPAKHLLTTIPFAWRQIWSFGNTNPLQPGGGSAFAVAANLISFAVFLALPLIALTRRRADWLAFSLFGFGLFWFHALLTHAIPRYSAPLIPLAVLSVLLLVHAVVVRTPKPETEK